MNLKSKIISLVNDINNGDINANSELDNIISQAYNIDYFRLFLSNLSKKDCIKTLKILFTNPDNVSDIELSTALSSLLTHSLLELKKDNTRYFDLKILDQTTQLTDFIHGDINKTDVKDFFQSYL